MSYFSLLNYDKNDTVATGLYHPKTTAILFDKLWIPSDFRHSQYGHDLGYDKIPLSVCIVEEVEEGRYWEELINKIFFKGKNFSGNSLEGIGIENLKIIPYVAMNRPFYTVEEDVLGLDFLSSSSRNIGLKRVVSSFKSIYNIEIVPIYLGYTAFEKSLMAHDDLKTQFLLQRYKDYKDEGSSILDLITGGRFSEPEEETTHSAYEICLSDIPIMVEENLEWEQVMEMRSDSNSIKKVHRFRRWVDTELEGKEKSEIIQSFEEALDDYKYALKKHGIMTAIGGLTTILSASSSVINAISGDFSTQISAGLAISGGLITYTASQLSDFFEKKREPIALIYELEKKFAEKK